MNSRNDSIASIALRRRGSWLIGQIGSWQMASVHGPLSINSAETGRQYFRVETSSEETLLVSRPHGEKGMRELRLDSILAAKSA